MSGDNRTSSDLGGAPGGLGASTGANPAGPAAGERTQTPKRDAETRIFEGTPPGHVPEGGEGGGAMSGRPQEAPDRPVRARDDIIVEGPDASAPGDETSGTGENSTGGTGAAAGGDAHLGKDGRKLGDPMNAARQVGGPGGGGT